MAKTKILKLRIRTREQRYIFEDIAPLEDLLQTRGRPIEYIRDRSETLITTVYFDTREGTWSLGLSQIKLRARSHQEPGRWWFELKRREGNRVDNWRRPMSVEAVLSTLSGIDRWKTVAKVAESRPLIPLFGVRCRRTAFEWTGLRVKLDREVFFFEVDLSSPLELTPPMGHVAGVVVEVKQEDAIPEWLGSMLEGHAAEGYSKSRYALALRGGAERPFLTPEPTVWSSAVTSA